MPYLHSTSLTCPQDRLVPRWARSSAGDILTIVDFPLIELRSASRSIFTVSSSDILPPELRTSVTAMSGSHGGVLLGVQDAGEVREVRSGLP